MKAFEFASLGITETRKNRMYTYVWNTSPVKNVTNRLNSKSRLGILELVNWQKALLQTSQIAE